MASQGTVMRRLERIGASSTGARQLRLDVLAELRRAVAFDAWVWVMTDPCTAVGVDPVADVPSFPALTTTIRLKYQAEDNRWTALAATRRPVALLSAVTSTSPGTDAWRDFLRTHGIEDVASLVFVDRYGTWSFLDLWRTEPFTRSEVKLLGTVPPILTGGLRASVAATFDVPPRGAAAARGPVVLVLDDDLAVLSQTPLSETWLAQLLPPEPGHAPVPASVLNVAAQLLAVEAGVDDHPASSSVHLADGLWVTLRAARLGDTGHLPAGAIAVTVEETLPDTRRELFGRAHGFTAREREVVERLAAGLDTETIARRLHISPYTVQDHVKATFAKSSASSRQALLARATGR